MDGVGLAVDFDAQFVAGGVGAQVDAGGEEGAHKASGVVVKNPRGRALILDICPI